MVMIKNSCLNLKETHLIGGALITWMCYIKEEEQLFVLRLILVLFPVGFSNEILITTYYQ